MGPRCPFLSRPLVRTLLLVILVGLLYWNALDGDFVFDDHDLILRSSRVQGRIPLTKLRPFFLLPNGRPLYRPLRTLSYRLDHALFGLNPWGFHAANLFYHAVNACLVYVLAGRLLGRPRAAMMAALLFAAHPVQTEAVAYISGRRDLLSALFVFLGVLAFLGRRNQGHRRGVVAIMICFLMGLLSKEMAITLPLILLAYDAVHQVMLPRGAKGLQTLVALIRALPGCVARDRRLYLPLLALMGVFSVIALFIAPGTGEYEYYGDTLVAMVFTRARIIAHYLKLLVFPLTLNADYSFDAFPISPSSLDPAGLLAVALIAAIVLFLVRLLPADPMAAFGGAWFFLTLLPVLHLIPHHEVVAEHYLYLPSFGLFLIAGHFGDRLLERQRAAKALYVAYAAIFLMLCVRTIVRNEDWRDSLTLWRKTVQTAPRSARAHANLAMTYLEREQLDLARRELEDAVRIAPGDGRYLGGLGSLYLKMGRLEAAEEVLDQALRTSAARTPLHLTLGVVYLRQQRLVEAESQFREVARRTHRPEPFLRLAQIAVELGQFDHAERELRAALHRMARVPAREALTSREEWREVCDALRRQSGRGEAQRLLSQIEATHPCPRSQPRVPPIL